jgi:hypothetical protein
MTSRGVPIPPALLLPLISRPDVPFPAFHHRSARRAPPRYPPSPLPPGVLGCARDIHDPTRSTSASLVLLFVSRCFYSSMSISSIIFLSIYTFILFSLDRDATSESPSYFVIQAPSVILIDLVKRA